jgi:DNA-directed RNA polymerase subunit alpha
MKTQKERSTKIEDLDISIRCLNSLKNMEIKDLKEMSNFTRVEISMFPYLGKRTITEISEMMCELGITWKDEKK